MSTGRAALTGAAIAILLVAGFVAAVAFHAIPVATQGQKSAERVVVAFVLAGSDGVVAPRTLDIYSREGSGYSVRSLFPMTPAQVPGTGGTTVADAYSFGGGDGLMGALNSTRGDAVDSWVIVDASAWLRLHGSSPVAFELPSQVEVFDGKRLYSFSEGHASVPADQLPELLQGAGFLSASDNAAVRKQVGDVLREALAAGGSTSAGLVRSDLNKDVLAQWLRGIGSARRVDGN
jgi:hypothetical protein